MQEFLITAVDIGTKNISASCGRWIDGEEVEIIGSSCVEAKGIKRGELIDKDKCKEQFIKVLNKLEDENEIDISNVYVGLSGNNFRLEETNGATKIQGTIRKNDINNLIKKSKRNININKDERICDIIINYYKVDDKITYANPVGLTCEELEVNITISIMKRDVIENFKYLCEGTKYDIEDFVVNAPTLKNIFFSNSRRGTKFIIGVGADITEIVQYQNGKTVKVIEIPLGGNEITNDISICANMSLEEAEGLKKEYSSSLEQFKVLNNDEKELHFGNGSIHKELFYKVCEARIEEILKYVKKALKKASHFNETCSIILYGEALTNFEGIDKLVKDIIGSNVVIIRKDNFGMKDFNDITSLAIVKEVHDKVELLYNNSSTVIEEFKKIESNFQASEYEIEKKENVKEDEKEINTSIVGKIRNFLGDIF